ncbi:MAG: hypothetical protein R3B70_30800 [Polyangiaceae bacterium]
MKNQGSFGRIGMGMAMVALAAGAALGVGACSGDGEQAGQACDAPADCYPDVDPADLKGEVLCLDKVTGGYCTHRCTTDADCCAVDGECKTGHPQVCAPFESTGEMLCFLSCEKDVIGDQEDTAYCHEFANDVFGCRSTGGGSLNRKVCVP